MLSNPEDQAHAKMVLSKLEQPAQWDAALKLMDNPKAQSTKVLLELLQSDSRDKLRSGKALLECLSTDSAGNLIKSNYKIAKEILSNLDKHPMLKVFNSTRSIVPKDSCRRFVPIPIN